MVIAGSFSAACGALLLGITAAVSKLTLIQSELARLQIDLEGEAREEAPAASTGLSTAALAGGLLSGKLFGRGESKDQDEKQAELPLPAEKDRPEPAVEPYEESEAPKASEPFLPFPPRTGSEKAEERDEEEAHVKIPDFLLAERRRETPVELRTSPANVSPFGDEPKLDETEEERRSDADRDDILEPSREPESESAREPESASVSEESAEPEEREEKAAAGPHPDATIVGTYNSGDNTYVMFSDGSIEAQTPRGVFRFQSLDELKAFIASGGEGGTPST
jgi:hypothetical protein